MIIKLAASILVSTALMLPMAGYTADSDKSSVTTMVKDSVITTKIKAELAAEKMSSLVNISVDTDHKGAVTLGGTAARKTAVDKAVSIAKAVKGVTSVDNQIKVVADK
jgi:hyperosmotically inducible protein